jgi:hypothetical protein
MYEIYARFSLFFARIGKDFFPFFGNLFVIRKILSPTHFRFYQEDEKICFVINVFVLIIQMRK